MSDWRSRSDGGADRQYQRSGFRREPSDNATIVLWAIMCMRPRGLADALSMKADDTATAIRDNSGAYEDWSAGE